MPLMMPCEATLTATLHEFPQTRTTSAPAQIHFLHVTWDIDALAYPPGVGFKRPKCRKRRSLRSCGKRRRRTARR
jgi:hypothetical protein